MQKLNTGMLRPVSKSRPPPLPQFPASQWDGNVLTDPTPRFYFLVLVITSVQFFGAATNVITRTGSNSSIWEHAAASRALTLESVKCFLLEHDTTFFWEWAVTIETLTYKNDCVKINVLYVLVWNIPICSAIENKSRLFFPFKQSLTQIQ